MTKIFTPILALVLYISLSMPLISQECLTSPIISCPSTFYGCPDSDISPEKIGFATATTNDSNCPAPIVSYRDIIETEDGCIGMRKIKRMWRADYPNELNPWLFAECSQIIVLSDNDSPVLVGCPTDITIEASSSSCSAVVTWTPPTATDACGIASLTSNFQPGQTFELGTTVVTYTARDNCGKETSCSFTITVTGGCCDAVPTISCPASIDICPNSSSDPQVTGTATASFAGGNNCGTPTITYTDQVSGAACSQTITRTWRATNPDNSSAFSTCVQTIRLVDNSAPAIANCPSDITVSAGSDCSAIVTWTAPSATDDCGLQSLISSHESGSTFAPGETVVTYTATDNCGNVTRCSFKVIVTGGCCNEAPIINCPPSRTVCPSSNIDPAETGIATATYTNAQGCKPAIITHTDTRSGESCNIVVTREWRATNPDDTTKFSICRQIITMKDDTGPTIAGCPTNITVDADQSCSAVVSWSPPQASDNCGLKGLTSTHSPGSAFPIGVTTVVYTFTDNCNNTSQCSFTITVNGNCCDEIPTILCPPAYTGCPTASIDPINTGRAIARYNNSPGCDAPVVRYTDQVSGTDCNKVIIRTWTATNPNNSSLVSRCEQVITLVDEQAPIIMNCPRDITISSNSSCVARVNWAPPMAIDGCGLKSLVSTHRPGDFFEIGTTTVTYTATDNCDNVSSCSFTVTVLKACCDDAPSITTCPADFVACPGASTDPSVTGRPIVNTSSGCTPDMYYRDDVINFSCAGSRIIKRTWIAVNQNNLADTCIQMISLIDTIAPIINNCPTDIIVDGGRQSVTWSNINASDNCGFTVSYSIANGSIFEVGVTTVIITVIDNCGNKTTCSFTVTVNPNPGSGLTVNCPSEVMIDCGATHQAIPAPTAVSDCPACEKHEIAGFIYMGSYKGHLYYCSRDQSTWPEAKATAEALGGQLVIINDAQENNFVKSIFQLDAAWIGLSRNRPANTFNWVDGSGLTYTNWYPGQPNNFNNKQDYVEILKNGQWNDQDNDKKREYIVEFSCIDIVQIAGPTQVKDIDGSASVSFAIKDACGNVDTCTYNVTLKNQFSLDCPDDFVVHTERNEAVVYWNPPTYNTCCDDCYNGGNINGFVYMGYFRGKHYYCSRSNFTWHQANQMSRDNGGNLAIISSKEENEYLARQLGNQIAWIGVSDHQTEDKWLDVNGKTHTFFNWRTGQPNNHQNIQHYVELEPTGYWNDNEGEFKREFIMEIPGCYPIRQTSGKASGSVFAVGRHKVSYEIIDECGNKATCAFEITVNKKDSNNSNYCSSYGISTHRTFIRQVQLDKYVFRTDNNGGYRNITNPCINVARGSKLSVLTQPGFTTQLAYQTYWKVYIDLNQDGDFDDEGEYLGRGRTFNALRGEFNIASHAKLGKTTLRIVMSLNDYPESCGANAEGETEDYCINIVNTKSNNINWSYTTALPVEMTEIVSSDVTITPNPAFEQATVFNSTGIAAITIFNGNGQIHLKRDYSAKNEIEILDLSNFDSGIYIVQVADALGEITTKKLIVTK